MAVRRSIGRFASGSGSPTSTQTDASRCCRSCRTAAFELQLRSGAWDRHDRMEPGYLTGPRLLAQPEAVRRRVAACLRGFSSTSGDHTAAGRVAYEVPVLWGAPLDPWVVRFFVVDVIGGKDLGRAEKVAWEAPIEMDGILIWFRHSKFGVRASAFGLESQEAADLLVADCLRRFGKAIPVVRRDLIDPLINETIAKGDFTVPNKFMYFLGMFEHLRSLSEDTASRARAAKPIRGDSGLSMSFPAIGIASEAEFEAVGALFAFFGLLEHLLVLGLAFEDFDPESERFDGFLRMNWGEKFKRVVGVNRTEDKTIYDTLKSLADGNRNPAAHGGVDRNVTNVQVHLTGYGAVSTGVNAGSTAPDYTFRPELDGSVDLTAGFRLSTGSRDGWEAVDRVLVWMRTGPLADAYTYGESRLPVWFDAESRRGLREAAASGRLDGFLDYRGHLVDQAANMDW